MAGASTAIPEARFIRAGATGNDRGRFSFE
jgi:hypothetical protein